MKVLCVLTDSHRTLFDEYFIKTIPCPENVVVKSLPVEGDGSYGTKNWQLAVNAKTKFVVSYLKSAEHDKFFLFSDVDVQFFPSFNIDNLINELIESNKDILFQKETSGNDNIVNSGFYIAKISPELTNFFELVLKNLESSNFKSDQRCINKLLKNSPISWGFLSSRYYARSHGFPPPATIFCHHANREPMVEGKIDQFELIKKYYESNLLSKIFAIFRIRLKNKISILLNWLMKK